MGIKIEVEVPDHMVHVISELMEETDSGSIRDVMTMALETLNWAYDKEKKGLNVVALSPSRDVYITLDRQQLVEKRPKNQIDANV